MNNNNSGDARFVKPLSDIEVVDGDKLQLSVEVAGKKWMLKVYKFIIKVLTRNIEFTNLVNFTQYIINFSPK